MPAEVAESQAEVAIKFLASAEAAEMTNVAVAEHLGMSESTVRAAKKEMERRRALGFDPAKGPPPEVKVERVPMEWLKIDMGTQMRPRLDKDAVDEYADMIDRLKPVDVVLTEDGLYVLAHGFHRYQAHRQEGRGDILCQVRRGTVRDAIEIAIAANYDNGVRRCKETMAAAVTAARRLHPRASVNAIAEMAHVSWAFADGVLKGHQGVEKKPRPALETNGQNGHAEDHGGDEDDVEGDDAPDLGEQDTALAEFLAGLTVIKAVLPEDKHAAIDAEATEYYRMREALKALKATYQKVRTKPEPGQPKLLYHHLIEQFLRIPHPNDLRVCMNCNGEGCEGKNGCRGRGYVAT